MTWFGWLYVGWLTFGALSLVALVGRDRKPITPGNAVATVLIAALLIAGFLWVGTGTGL